MIQTGKKPLKLRGAMHMDTTTKMIFFDIDGTLLPEGENDIPESTVKALQMAKANGHLIFINTGRTYFNVGEKIRNLNFDGYVCGCGTYIYFRDRLLFSSTIPHNQCVEIIQLMRDCLIPGFFEENNCIFFDDQSPATDSFLADARRMFGTRGVLTPESVEDTRFTFDKILVKILPESDVRTFRAYVDKYLTYIDRGGNIAEIIQKDYSKGTGIQFMCDYLDIPLANCYAVGDSTNDLAMLDYAPNSIAMGNSMPEILPHCTYVTTDIKKDGIYNALKHFKII